MSHNLQFTVANQMHNVNCWHVPGCMDVTRSLCAWSQVSEHVNAGQQVLSADVAHSQAERPPRNQAAEDVTRLADDGAG